MICRILIIYPFFSLIFLSLAAQTGDQWPVYGNDPGGSRFSKLKQINTGNVNKLKLAWTYQTGELKTYEGTGALEKAAFEATPIMIEGVLYFSTPSDRVIALDAASGREKWVFDPGVNLRKDYSEITSRGVASWRAIGRVKTSSGQRRIFVGTIDGRLIALDAATGKPIPSFGKNGVVDLKEDVSVVDRASPCLRHPSLEAPI